MTPRRSVFLLLAACSAALPDPTSPFVLPECAPAVVSSPTSSGEPGLTLRGASVTREGGPVPFSVLVEVVEQAVWTGAAPNGSGYYADLESEDGTFEFRSVPPGSYALVATAGTCNGTCPVAGTANEVIEANVVVTCNE